jgi:hypothetical protein
LKFLKMLMLLPMWNGPVFHFNNWPKNESTWIKSRMNAGMLTIDQRVDIVRYFSSTNAFRNCERYNMVTNLIILGRKTRVSCVFCSNSHKISKSQQILTI